MMIFHLCLYFQFLISFLSECREDFLIHSNMNITTVDKEWNPSMYKYNLPNISRRIFGGNEVKSMTQFPYMAFLLKDAKRGEYNCGATILSPKYLLTAAHCLRSCPYLQLDETANSDERMRNFCRDEDKTGYAVIVGSTVPESAKDKFKVKEFFIHPKYKPYDNDNQCILNYDIAIVELQKPMKFSKTISNVRLPPTHGFNFRRNKCTIIGWGGTKAKEDNSLISQFAKFRHLKATTVNIISNKQCVKYLKKSKLNELPYKDKGLCRATHLCSIDVHNVNGICRGDSGGPIMCNNVQVGVTSWAADPEYVGQHITNQYSRVDVNVEWIKNITSIK